MQTIGKNREDSLKQLRAGTGEYYIPPPNTSMPCSELDGRYRMLNDQILFWNDELLKLKFSLFSGDKKEAGNITEIINIQMPLLAQYEQEMQRCLLHDDPGGGGGNGNGNGNGGNGNTNPATTGAGIMDWVKKNPLIVAGAGVGIILLLKKSRVIGKPDQITWLLLLGGAAVILANRKEPPALIETME